MSSLPSIVSATSCFFHFLSETEWPHVGPYFVNVLETLGLRTFLLHRVPTRRYLLALWPNRVLLLMINHNRVYGRRVIVFEHAMSPTFAVS